MIRNRIIGCIFFCLPLVVFGQSFYDLNTIQEIKMYTAVSNWDYQMDTAKASGFGTYMMFDSLKVNGANYLKCGVKYKGNSTYNANRTKNPFHIKLDFTFKSSNYQNIQDIKLGNGWSDPSMVREAIGYHIAAKYMNVSKSNFAKVFINDVYWGIYSNQEDVGDDFALKNFYSSKNEYFKCNPKFGGGPITTGSSLLYSYGVDSTLYYNLYERQSDYGWKELLQFMDTLNNVTSSIGPLLDLDRTFWMHAFNNVCVNLDSYSGQFRQNYYMYRDHNKQWIPIIWDLNMCFGSFAQSGSGNLNLSSMKSMTPLLHKNDAAWPLINKLLSNTTYERKYIAHMRTINDENFALGNPIYPLGQTLQTLVDSAVKNDVNFLTTYTDFKKNLDTNAAAGTCGIFQLMNARNTYLTSLYPLNIPTINTIQTSNSNPVYGAKITITCKANSVNIDGVSLGYRSSKTDRFTLTTMFDDGAHNDGAANDGTFGAEIEILGLNTQYYIYGENNSAGKFSPERAEHEFYTVTASIPMASTTEIVINEFVANNISGITNERGKSKDWVELYNTTNNALRLNSLYLSDSTFLTKWRFPGESIIKPKEHLLVWTDDLDTTFLEMHASFNLNELGEKIILSNGTAIVDQNSFGLQSADIGLARCPDGTGSFMLTSKLSPRMMNNCTSDIKETENITYQIYPNPSHQYLYIKSEVSHLPYKLIQIDGSVVLSGIKENNIEKINIEQLSTGIYFLNIEGMGNKKIIIE